MKDAVLNERGLTLIELTVVFVLASLVMVGLVGFYLNSQATWVDGSREAQTQREATLLIETMSDSIRFAAKAVVTNYPAGDTLHQMVTLYAPADTVNAWYAFWWSPSDSLIHGGKSPGIGDRGPVITSRIDRFQLRQLQPSLIELTALEAHASNADVVLTSTRFALYNR